MTPLEIVNQQAEDEGLWFIASTAPEAYLQQELRRLHAVVEQAATAAPTSELAVSVNELFSSLKFIRTNLYAAQAQMNDFDDAIIGRHVYDAYKRIDDLCREIAVHGVSSGGAEE